MPPEGCGTNILCKRILVELGNDSDDCVEIWYAFGYPLAMHYTQLMGGVQVHVRTSASLFQISGTAGPIGLNFGCWELLSYAFYTTH